MKENHVKHYLSLSTHEKTNIQMANVTIESSTSKKLLAITTDNKLKFDKHIETSCQKSRRK